jgi:hypothetical protein
MEKLNLVKAYKELYSPSARDVSVVNVPNLNYIMVDGQGAPDGPDAQEAFQALFPVAYTIKFSMKKKGMDYTVMPVEGLWWADDMNDFVNGIRDRWKWTYMIMQPDFVSGQVFAEAIESVKKKKNIPGLAGVRFSSFEEGKAAQILHTGPFSEEGPNIQRIHDYIKQSGGVFDGHWEKHHEIYLSDMRRVSPDKMKTVLRQPFH